MKLNWQMLETTVPLKSKLPVASRFRHDANHVARYMNRVAQDSQKMLIVLTSVALQRTVASEYGVLTMQASGSVLQSQVSMHVLSSTNIVICELIAQYTGIL